MSTWVALLKRQIGERCYKAGGHRFVGVLNIKAYDCMTMMPNALHIVFLSYRPEIPAHYVDVVILTSVGA